MRNVLTASVGIAVFLVGTAALQTPADARQVGGVRAGGGGMAYRGTVNRNFSASRNINRNANINRNVNVNRNVNRNVNVNRSYAYRNGRRGYWRNGVWIAAPAIAGATYGYVGSSCNYLYNQWQKTNSVYWRDRYRRCANGN